MSGSQDDGMRRKEVSERGLGGARLREVLDRGAPRRAVEGGGGIGWTRPYLPRPLTRGHISLPLGDPISPARQRSPLCRLESPHAVRIPLKWGIPP